MQETSLVDDWIAEGEAKGRTQGRAEGEAKGRAEGEVKGRAEGEVKGRAEGEVKGRAEGEARGKTEEARRMAIRAIERKFGGVPVEIQRDIDTADVEWCERLLDAAVVADSLAALRAEFRE